MAAANVITTLKQARPSVTKAFRNAILHRPDPSVAAALSTSPHLILFFPWVGAKEKYAHKFVEAWSRRGFSVLHVSTPVMDLVRPKTGTEVTASRVVDFLTANDSYRVIFHGVSVGGYISQRVLMDAVKEKPIISRITHQVYDSFTHVAGFQSGVAHAVKPVYKNIVNTALKVYSSLADLSCFYEASDFVSNFPTPTPAFFMHSLADKVADYKHVRPMLPSMAKGSPVYVMIIPEEEQMGHVSLFRTMGEATYMSSIIRFLKKTKFSAIKDDVLDEQDPTCEQARICIERTSQIDQLAS